MSDWRHYAACLGTDLDLWFPVAVEGTPAYVAQVTEAKSICARCPVRAQCLEWALAVQSDGVAGGLDASERSALRTAGVTHVSPLARRAAELVERRAILTVRELAAELGCSPRTAERRVARARELVSA